MIEPREDRTLHVRVERRRRRHQTRARVDLAAHRDFQPVVMPVPKRVVALAEQPGVLLRSEPLRVQPVRGREWIPAGQVSHSSRST